MAFQKALALFEVGSPEGGARRFAPFIWHNLAFDLFNLSPICTAEFGLAEMGHFQAVPDVVAVAADRLVSSVRVDDDGSVVVRDLANGGLSTISASELRAPPALWNPTVAPVLSIVQTMDSQWERVVRQVGLRCSSERLTPPSRKAILARPRALDTREVAKARLQPSEAAALVDPVRGTYRMDNALEVVQIDHTPVDVIVVDEAHRLPIGRPWLTLAIDVATRVVVGFYVSLEAPSSTSVALCLTHAVLPRKPGSRLER